MMNCERRRSFVLLPFISCLIAACAHRPNDHSTAGAGTSPRNEWSGRLAVHVEDRPSQSYSSAFELKGSAKQGSLDLLSPLGNTIAQLVWQPGLAQLRATGSTREFSSLDALVTAATGTALPVATLFDWLAGLPTPVDGWSVDLSRQAQGRYVAKRLGEPLTELRVILDQ